MEGLKSCILLLPFLALIDAQNIEIMPPTSQEKKVGSGLVLTCSVNGAANNDSPQLEWLGPDGSKIIANDLIALRVKKKELKLLIRKLESKDAGTYTCQGYPVSPTELQKKEINISIFKDITITDCSALQRPVVKTNSVINCTVDGNPSPSVVWYYNGNSIQTQGSKYEQVPNGLKIYGVSESDNGNYTVDAQIATHSSFKERKIIVEVTIPPDMTSPPVLTNPIEGESFEMHCKADGKPKPTYSWFKDGHELTEPEFMIDTVNGILKKEKVAKSDEGEYSCFAKNGGGTVKGSAELKVTVPPQKMTVIHSMVKELEEAKLVCEAEGDPLPSMIWQKITKSSPFVEGPQASDDRIVVSLTSENLKTKITLTIREVTPEDAGNYTCLASNKAGKIEKVGLLEVQFKPNFKDAQSVAYNWVGSTQNISCIANSNPVAVIIWKKGNSDIKKDATYQTFQFSGINLAFSYLQIKVTQANEDSVFGDYVCQARNIIGASKHTIKLKRASQPGKPSNVLIKGDSPTTITLEITKPGNDGGIPVTKYKLHFGPKDGNMTNKFIPADVDKLSLITLENLIPNKEYVIKVFAGNAVGLSNQPMEITHKLKPASIPGAVEIISSTKSKSVDSYHIKWKAALDNGSPVTNYIIFIRRVEVENEDTWKIKVLYEQWRQVTNLKNPTDLFYHVKGLTGGQYYQLKIIALNAKGESRPKLFVFHTYPGTNGVSKPKPTGNGNTNVYVIPTKDTRENLESTKAQSVSTGAIIGIIIVLIIIVLLVIDLSCYFKYKKGVVMFLHKNACQRTAKKSEKDQNVEAGDSKETAPLAKSNQKEAEPTGEKNPETPADSVTDDKQHQVMENEYDLKRKLDEKELDDKDADKEILHLDSKMDGTEELLKDEDPKV